MSNSAQLDLFRERLPRKPYHTDDLDSGLFIAGSVRAAQARYVQPNGPTHRYWIVFDIDRPGALLDWDDRGAPAPNIVVVNQDNHHGHLIYGLDVPVRTAPDGKAAPLRYAAAVEAALREKLDADLGYSGFICKNPLSDHWQVQVWEPRPYDLAWLSEYVDLTAYSDRRKRLPEYGLGRNCTLFERLSQWAYRAIRQGWPDFNPWLAAVQDRATGYNAQFEQPLPASEVRHTAKSVAKWTHRNMSPEGFRAWQAEQGRKGGKAKGAAYEQKRIQARLLAAKGMAQGAIAVELDVSRMTVSRWLKSGV